MQSEVKIQKALELLKEASKEKRMELQKVIADLCDRVKEAENVAADTIKSAAHGIDRSAHEKPWHYIIGAAISGFLIARFFNSRR